MWQKLLSNSVFVLAQDAQDRNFDLSLVPNHLRSRGCHFAGSKPCPNIFFKKMGQSRPLFVYFRLFYMTQIKYKLIKALMVRSGLEPRAAGWKV